MSKTKQIKSFFNNKSKNNLLSQQNIIKKKYENLEKNIDNNEKFLSTKNSNDFNAENCDNIKHNLKELPQYSSLYLKRLEMTKKTLIQECKNKWPKIHICPNILDLKGTVNNYFLFNI